MLELGRELAASYRSVYLTFREEDRCWDFVDSARQQGFEAVALNHDTPRLLSAFREVVQVLKRYNAAVLLCHGYKANLLGLLAARRLGIPIISGSSAEFVGDFGLGGDGDVRFLRNGRANE